jgi:hypothetical protein
MSSLFYKADGTIINLKKSNTPIIEKMTETETETLKLQGNLDIDGDLFVKGTKITSNNSDSQIKLTGVSQNKKSEMVMEVFSDTTNWTRWVVPKGVTKIQVEMVGGGGSGANVKQSEPNKFMSGGGGGGGGGYIKIVLSVNPDDNFKITVGSGGKIHVNTNGKTNLQMDNDSRVNIPGMNGEDTVFQLKGNPIDDTITLTAFGGTGAPSIATQSVYSAGGLGKYCSKKLNKQNKDTSALMVWGGDGHPGLIGKFDPLGIINGNNIWAAGGNGGSSYFGSGGRGGTVMSGDNFGNILNSDKNNQKNSLEMPYGAGGGGGSQNGVKYMGGTAGAQGVVIITYMAEV